jgi:hypothetical protein
MIVLTLVAGVATTARAQGASRKYGDLLKRLPERANVLLLVDVDALYKSPLGKREKWQDKAADRPTGVLGLSNDVAKVAVAMQIDFQTLEERWKLGMLQPLVSPPKLSVLAAREGGYVEQIQAQSVAWTPRNFYLLAFPDKIVGFVAPANRQAISQGLLATIIKPRTFPPSWADRAIQRADGGSPIVLAVDLRDTISPRHAEAWLKALEMPVVKKNLTAPELTAKTLATVQSAFLQFDVQQTIQGTLRIEFENSVQFLQAYAKELVLEILDDYGADVDELRKWTGGVEGKTITLNGPMSEAGVRRILSVVSTPTLTRPYRSESEESDEGATEKATQTASAPPEPSAAVALKATQQHFRAIVDTVESLKSHKGSSQASLKLWYERAAKQIEEMPLLNVDEEVLEWGSVMARTMREMAYGINYNVKDRTYRLAGTANGYYGGWGYYGGGNSKGYSADVLKKQSNSVLDVELNGRWQVIETSIADMRRKLVTKYKVDF